MVGLMAVFLPISSSMADEQWLRGQKAELQALDKITARISTLTADVGTPFRYGSLQIVIHTCTYRPPTIAPEHAALMEIRNIDHMGQIGETPIFQGWMFASSPGLNALEHPVYDVSVVACKKD